MHRRLTYAPPRKERELALQAPEEADSIGRSALSRPRLRWWREVLTIAIFYELYSLARNTQGSGSTTDTHAFRNARAVIHLERAVGLYHEQSIQSLFLSVRPVMKAFNVYYGTAHFLVTAGVLMWLFIRHPDRYSRWRWALASTTLLALIGFLAFPLMPPRLITSEFGVGSYVDTLHTIGGLWNFEEGPIAKLSNQYAAMPSLHFAWSLWCLLALWPRVHNRFMRALGIAHPTLTLVAIVATANHYWLDAAAGALTLLLGWLLGGVLGAGAVSRVGTWPRRPLRRRSPRPEGAPALCDQGSAPAGATSATDATVVAATNGDAPDAPTHAATTGAAPAPRPPADAASGGEDAAADPPAQPDLASPSSPAP